MFWSLFEKQNQGEALLCEPLGYPCLLVEHLTCLAPQLGSRIPGELYCLGARAGGAGGSQQDLGTREVFLRPDLGTEAIKKSAGSSGYDQAAPQHVLFDASGLCQSQRQPRAPKHLPVCSISRLSKRTVTKTLLQVTGCSMLWLAGTHQPAAETPNLPPCLP